MADEFPLLTDIKTFVGPEGQAIGVQSRTRNGSVVRFGLEPEFIGALLTQIISVAGAAEKQRSSFGHQPPKSRALVSAAVPKSIHVARGQFPDGSSGMIIALELPGFDLAFRLSRETAATVARQLLENE